MPASLTGGAASALSLGDPEKIPFLAKQTRLTFARCGITDPLSLDDYKAHGGLTGLAERRRDDAGRHRQAGHRIPACAAAAAPASRPASSGRRCSIPPADRKYIVCNADEGDSGTFADRMIMEGDPFVLIEGMAIAGIATGATKGFVYIRSEYPHAVATMSKAVEIARQRRRARRQRAGLAQRLRHGNPRRRRRLCLRRGNLAAESAWKASAAWCAPSRRCRRIKGLFGKPTVINNVISLASVPVIMDRGAAFYKDFGMGRSRGTIPIQIAGNVKHGGLFEAAFGLTLGEIVDDIGGGTATGRPVKAVQVGGPLGAYFPRALFDTPFDYEAFAAKDGLIGHAGIVVFDDTADMLKQARFAMEFCAIESCGKCTPCRIGSTRGVETLDKIAAGIEPEKNLALVTDLCNTMKFGSLCALGGFTPYPVMSAINHFPRRFQAGARRRSSRIGAAHERHGSRSTKSTTARRPRNPRSMVTLTVDGFTVTRAGRHLDHARLDGGRHRDPEALRHRHGRRLRLLPALPGRDRGPQRHAVLLHDAGGAGHGGAHADRPAEGHPPRRDGALHLRPSARLPDLRGQWRLRIAGHGRRRRPARRALRL